MLFAFYLLGVSRDTNKKITYRSAYIYSVCKLFFLRVLGS